MPLGIISGTGLYDLGLSSKSEEIKLKTPYGEVALYKSGAGNKELYFLPRHGIKHTLPPHLINYRANICALSLLGVNQVLAFCSVGSMDNKIPPGSLMLLEQFIDASWGREHTFCEEGSTGHVEMSEPYCPRLNRHLQKVAKKAGLNLPGGGVYLCTQGPRFETPAEIKAYASWGANLVGMTGVPEVSLAREAGLCYASVAVVANYAAGLAKTVDPDEITLATNLQQKNLAGLLELFIEEDYYGAACSCREAKIAPCFKWR